MLAEAAQAAYIQTCTNLYRTSGCAAASTPPLHQLMLSSSALHLHMTALLHICSSSGTAQALFYIQAHAYALTHSPSLAFICALVHCRG